MKNIAIIGAVLGLAMSATTAMAGGLPDGLDKFEATGETKSCVNIRNIQSTRVLDDQHILFRMHGSKYFLNKLDHRCSRLGFERSFSYKISGSRLCNVDLIRVLDRHGLGVSCSLGSFEELEKKKADQEN